MTENLLLTRPAGAGPQSLADYESLGGYEGLRRALAGRRPEHVLEEIERSGLRGRGGAAFPTARKWRLAAGRDAVRKIVVANGGEHEPGSRKDRFLMERYPHEILEGLLLCAFATGAETGYVYVIEDMEGPLAGISGAIEELRAAKLLGANIAGSSFSFEIEVHEAPTTYVAGEETAALNSIEGKEAKPRKKPPFPGEAGIHGWPTTVDNVETLAHAAWIGRHGGGAFAAIGTEQSKGTMLFTLGDQVNRPGVYELPFGATYRRLIDDLGGGTRSGKAIRAILPSMSCGFLPADHLDVPISHESLASLGTSPGCGGVRLVAEGDDVVALTLEIARFFMREQCGQCPPCRMQTNQFAHVLQGVANGGGPGYEQKLRKLAEFARGKGNCSLIAMSAAPVLSALRCFPDDFARAAGS
ncbi:MAG: NADH-quinone oxidoreductase subunit NuoF [Planctomycetota bacterium]